MTKIRSFGFHRVRQRRTVAVAELLLALVLAASTAVAATAISVEVANAARLAKITHQNIARAI